MIVCHCHAKSDREIRDSVRNGANTRAKVLRTCSAGGSCGGCIPAIDDIISSEETKGLPEFNLGGGFLADGLATS